MSVVASVETYRIAVPLKKPFKTALRTVEAAEAVIVHLATQDGRSGFGEAPPTHVITGDTLDAIERAIQLMGAGLIGMDLRHREQLFDKLHKSLVGNTSAKAAVDMALYDLIAQQAGMPLTQFLGGYRKSIETDYTVSVNAPEEMAADAADYEQQGFTVLKVKVGIDQAENDFKRIQAIRARVGNKVTLRLDANQGWDPKSAVRIITRMEDAGFNIELIEQPVPANDIEGLKFVTDRTLTPIMADESVFSPIDARRVLELRAADLINIKLMKAGGIHQALKINALAETYGVPCMTGSMIESKLGLTAAAHFAASQPNVTRFDFDAPLMLKEDLLPGGIQYSGKAIHFSDEPGLGIDAGRFLETLRERRG
ncbi:dipeptide epimerase [Planococcus maritimus]|uniref:dipeptide epimerase n=1 Tax=Planococcus maritimus TaxID=192421 RepID=UPI000794F1B5|nr:dipeptide epimerase [Planococcus maritimus]KYG59548.1 dipeptide epimerase [Planococcus maritimus]OED33247.1 dipeptide epimerase [Planococcus maritimus]